MGKMILGHGDLASVLVDQPHLLFFASGVSNSAETREAEYGREIDLLMKQDKSKHIVYFGSLSIFYTSDTRYAKHKMHMEELVKDNFRHYTIVRLGNIAWGTNPNTLINFFRNKVARGEPIEVRDTHRYVVEKEEFLHWMDLIPERNCEMNLTGQYLTVKEIINKYVYLGIRPKQI